MVILKRWIIKVALDVIIPDAAALGGAQVGAVLVGIQPLQRELPRLLLRGEGLLIVDLVLS